MSVALHAEPEELLILTKTYPSPSAGYRETTCVAAITRAGELRRIFPVPFRLLDGDARFRKWEWIHARVSRPNGDHRPESRRIDADSIQRSGNVIPIKNGDWSQRTKWLESHVVPGFTALEQRRLATGQTLGVLRVSRILELRITAVKEADWTDADWIKLSQDGLFDTVEIKKRPPLRKLPFDFHYRYECIGPDGKPDEATHKLTDWEVGALYWKCISGYGQDGWEEKFRQRFEIEFANKDLYFLMGTIHRFPKQWLIVGIIYPPKPAPVRDEQLGLSLDL
jgi:hypothetical protein